MKLDLFIEELVIKSDFYRIITTACFLFLFIYALAQPNIIRIEYYIDTDPGFGKATSVSVTPSINIVDKVIAINPTNLAEGVHRFYVRAMNATGAWGFTNSMLFYKPISSGGNAPLPPGPASNITKLEYYIDIDPGFGKGTNVSITPGTDLSNVIIPINPGPLAEGVHRFYVRAMNANGAWGFTNSMLFYKPISSGGNAPPPPIPASNITKLEYYIDIDPGFGKGTNVSITPGTDLSNVIIPINPNTLTDGVHTFYVRSRNANGAWSFTNALAFFKPIGSTIDIPAPPLPPSNIVRLEYYIDTDPGYGKAKAVTITPGLDIKDVTIGVDITNLALGKHMFYVRALNAKGAWSMMNALEFSNGVVSVGPYYVDSSAISGLNNGSSWANAFLNLQDAIKIAKAHDTIFVAKGTYYPDRGVGLTNDDRTLSFNIRDSSVMFGGFPSGGGSLASRNWNTNKTILSGEIQNDSDSTNNSLHVVITTHVSAITVVDGFYITKAYNDAFSGSVGGGWFNDGSGMGNASNPVIRNCTFNKNYGTFGGGLCNNGENGNSSPLIQDCFFTHNNAYEGGAILNFGHSGNASPTIVNCDFIENVAISGGGAIRNKNVSFDAKGQNCVTLLNCRFYNNLGPGAGGALNFSSDSTCTSTITNCEFRGNSAGASIGGVLYTDKGRLEFINCILSGNFALQGAVILNNLTDISLTNCIISGNYNSSPSGIILNTGSETKRLFPQINNSIFWNNSNIIFYNYYATPQVNHSLFSVSQFDSIFVAQADIEDSALNKGGNIFGQDPKFVNSPSSTAAPTLQGDFHLQAQSIAINNGSNSLVKSLKDLDGNARIQNGIVDMGVYEFMAAQSAPSITSLKASVLCQGDTVTMTGSDFLSSLDSNIQSVKINAVQGTVVSASTILIKAIFNQAVKGKVTVSNNNGTAISSDTVTILAAPTVNSISNQEVCVGGNTTAITITGTGTSYSWTNNNTATGLAASGTGNIAAFISKNIGTSQIGSIITVTPLNSNVCKGIPISFNILVDPILTAAPIISQTANNLLINSIPGGLGITSYQWMKDSVAIPGANSSNYLPIVNGSYTASFTNICGNGPKSNAINFVIPISVAKGIYVDSSATGLNNGTSWANAYVTLQDALVSAKAGDTILVAQGTYYPDQGKNLTNDDRSLSFNIPDGVVVYGGFPSGGSSLSLRNWMTNKTILSGEIQQDDIKGNNSYHVISTHNVSGMTTIDGFNIIKGNANGMAATQSNGGGWYNDGSGLNAISSPTIKNCTFNFNSATNGAAIFNNADSNGTTSPIIINSIFLNNTAGGNGGAIYNLATQGGLNNISLTNCLIRNNNATNGGAIYNNGVQGNCTPGLINCLLYLNSAANGAAIASIGTQGTCVTTIINSIVWSNIKIIFANSNSTVNLSYSLTEATTGYIDKGNNKIGQNPFFVAINTDLHLTQISPAINAGNNTANTMNVDIEGHSRVIGSVIDMGPYEYQASNLAGGIPELRSYQSPIELFQNIPNPFNDITRIGIVMPEETRGIFTISDILGRTLKVYNRVWSVGYNEVVLDKTELYLPGMYYYNFSTSGFKATRKMILVK